MLDIESYETLLTQLIYKPYQNEVFFQGEAKFSLPLVLKGLKNVAVFSREWFILVSIVASLNAFVSLR